MPRAVIVGLILASLVLEPRPPKPDFGVISGQYWCYGAKEIRRYSGRTYDLHVCEWACYDRQVTTAVFFRNRNPWLQNHYWYRWRLILTYEETCDPCEDREFFCYAGS